MTLRKCDRCGKIIENMYEGYRWEADYYNGERLYFDICNDCYAKFIKFMKSGDQNEDSD